MNLGFLFLITFFIYQTYAGCCSSSEITCSNQEYATCDACDVLETCKLKNRKCNTCQNLFPNCNTCDCTTKSCQSCLPQYYLDKTKTICLPLLACPLANCAAGYYANVQCKCLECTIPNCQVCSRSNFCDTCRANTHIYSGLFNTLDQIKCVRTSTGVYLNFFAGMVSPGISSETSGCTQTIASLNPGTACLSQAEHDYIESASYSYILAKYHRGVFALDLLQLSSHNIFYNHSFKKFLAIHQQIIFYI
ncbi:hypothetical protein pb186bvf_004363 [Paramecium bursaria]